MMSLHGSQNPQGSSHSIWTESSLSPPLPCRLLAEQIHCPHKGRTGPRSPPWKVCGHVLLPLQVPVLALTPAPCRGAELLTIARPSISTLNAQPHHMALF